MTRFVHVALGLLLLATPGLGQQSPVMVTKAGIEVFQNKLSGAKVTSVRAGESFLVVAHATVGDGYDRPDLQGELAAVIHRADGQQVVCQSVPWKGQRRGPNQYAGEATLDFPISHPRSAIILRIKGAVAAALSLQVDVPGKAKYVRFQVEGSTSYGILEGPNESRVRQLSGDLFDEFKTTDKSFALKEVRLLPPTVPTQVLALAGNYKSHLSDAEIPPKLRIVQPFFKSPSCLIGNGESIVIPKDSPGPVHYEAELVIVIGKKAKKVSREKALEYVFGVTCGNDVSERYWQNDEQNKDVQWWRAKGADTFGPVGPCIATGINYDDLMMRLRLNGELKLEESTHSMIHNVAATVSGISRYVTLHPGDLIFTGTAGKTQAIKPGDVVEVELENVGVLRNPVKAEE